MVRCRSPALHCAHHGTLGRSPAVQARVLIRDRTTLLTAAVLILLAIAAWVFVIASSMTMTDDMGMDGGYPSLLKGLAFTASWGIMMAAMMLPSALPMIALYGAIQRKGSGAGGVPVALFTSVYVVLWAVAGIPVYVARELLEAVAPEGVLAYGVALVLIAAGAYQLSPLKQVCLRACRSPLGFLLGHWRAGVRGSLALGWAHATYCLGCCWALMGVLVVAGAMGLPWVLLIAAVVAAEKLLPGGEWIARVAGATLVLLGLVVAWHPGLVSALRGEHMM